MKVTKGQLKSLLKECIKELLDEGAFNNALEEVLTEASAQQTQQPMTGHQVMREQSKDLSVGNFENPNERLTALSKQMAAQVAGNSSPQQKAILENIFADTAATTLQEQPMGSGGAGGNMRNLLGEPQVSEQQQQVDMNQLQALSMGGDISRWAQAAFANKKKA